MGACTSTELQVTDDQRVIISASVEACWSVISDVTTVAQWNAANIKSVDLLSGREPAKSQQCHPKHTHLLDRR
jgi:hypothetical protein